MLTVMLYFLMFVTSRFLISCKQITSEAEMLLFIFNHMKIYNLVVLEIYVIKNKRGENGISFISLLKEVNHIAINRLNHPLLYPDFIFALSPTGRKFDNVQKTVYKMLKKVCLLTR